MKKGLYIFILLLCGMTSCRTSYLTHSVNYISEDSQTINLRCDGFGQNELTAITDAEKYAVESILFRGIPDSQLKDPLVNINENDARKNNKKYFDELLEEKRYKTFIISSIPTTKIHHVKGGGGQKSISIDVSINLRALRTDLEQNGIIRKFGL